MCFAYTKLKDKFYCVAIKPDTLYCTECLATKKQYASMISVVEMKILV